MVLCVFPQTYGAIPLSEHEKEKSTNEYSVDAPTIFLYLGLQLMVILWINLMIIFAINLLMISQLILKYHRINVGDVHNTRRIIY